MTDEVKPCNLDEILARAEQVTRKLEVCNSPSVIVHVNDAFAIVDVSGTDVPAMAAEIKAWRETMRAHMFAANVRPFTVEAADTAGDLYDKLLSMLPRGYIEQAENAVGVYRNTTTQNSASDHAHDAEMDRLDILEAMATGMR